MEDLMQNGKLPSDVHMQFAGGTCVSRHGIVLNLTASEDVCINIIGISRFLLQWRRTNSGRKSMISGVRRRSSESTVDGLLQLTIPEMMQDKSIQDNSLFRDRLSGRSNVDTAVACGPTWGAF